jgi:hypothetical protein
MALTPETGAGLADADSYCSLAFADAHHAARGITLWATMSTNEREQVLRRATDFMVQVYRSKWAGRRVTEAQALDWPRAWVPRQDFDRAPSTPPALLSGDLYYPSNVVPVEVQRACAELAYRGGFGPLAPDIERQTVREKLDTLEVEYDPSAAPYARYRAIENLLAPFLLQTASGIAARVVRT